MHHITRPGSVLQRHGSGLRLVHYKTRLLGLRSSPRPALQRALGRPTVWHTEACWWTMLREVSLRGNALADQGLCALVDVSQGIGKGSRVGRGWIYAPPYHPTSHGASDPSSDGPYAHLMRAYLAPESG